mgnify:CR=1 FL=1
MMSKDEALERAIITSVRNPRHCLYFKEPRGVKVASTMVTTNEIFRLSRPEGVGQEVWNRYEKSFLLHEVTHSRSCLNTEFRRALIISSIASPDLVEPKEFFFVYNHEIVPFLEAFALYDQLLSDCTPEDLRAGVLEFLRVHNPAQLRIMVDINRIMKKFEKKLKKKANIFDLILDSVFASPNPVEDRISERFKLIRNLPEEEIPELKDELELMNFLIEKFEKEGKVITSHVFFSYAGYSSILHFLDFLRELGVGLESCLFSVLNELDVAFVPIVYEVDDLEEIEARRISKCMMWEMIKDGSFFQTIPSQVKVLRKEIARVKKCRRMLNDFIEVLLRLDNVKKSVFSKCPGIEFCRGREECMLKSKLFEEIRKAILLEK